MEQNDLQIDPAEAPATSPPAGIPITKYADARRLTINARLQLVQKLCGTVSKLHRALVVHGDIKPENVLVSSQRADPVLLEPDNSDGSSASDTDAKTMWSAPEQVLGEPVTTQTDVYAIGLMLFELASGHHAYSDTAHLQRASLAERATKWEPTDLAALVTKSTRPFNDRVPLMAASEICDRRQTRLKSLQADLKRGLSAIIAKAIAKSPEDRYGSVADLNEDLQNFLDRRPIAAVGDESSIRAKVFQNPPRAVAAAALAGIVGGFALAWPVMSHRVDSAVRARDRIATAHGDTLNSRNTTLKQDLRAYSTVAQCLSGELKYTESMKDATQLYRISRNARLMFAEQALEKQEFKLAASLLKAKSPSEQNLSDAEDVLRQVRLLSDAGQSSAAFDLVSKLQDAPTTGPKIRARLGFTKALVLTRLGWLNAAQDTLDETSVESLPEPDRRQAKLLAELLSLHLEPTKHQTSGTDFDIKDLKSRSWLEGRLATQKLIAAGKGRELFNALRANQKASNQPNLFAEETRLNIALYARAPHLRRESSDALGSVDGIEAFCEHEVVYRAHANAVSKGTRNFNLDFLGSCDHPKLHAYTGLLKRRVMEGRDRSSQVDPAGSAISSPPDPLIQVGEFIKQADIGYPDEDLMYAELLLAVHFDDETIIRQQAERLIDFYKSNPPRDVTDKLYVHGLANTLGIGGIEDTVEALTDKVEKDNSYRPAVVLLKLFRSGQAMFPGESGREAEWIREFQSYRTSETRAQYLQVLDLIGTLTDAKQVDVARQLGRELLGRLDAKIDIIGNPARIELSTLIALAKAGSGKTYADRLNRLKDADSLQPGELMEEIEATKIRLLFEAGETTEALDLARTAFTDQLYQFVGGTVRLIVNELEDAKDPAAKQWAAILWSEQ